MFLYTGHGDLWKNSEWPTLAGGEARQAKATFISGEPGFGRSACEYFAEQKIILTGGDTSANDAQPMGEIEGEAVPCHTELQTRHGIWNIENLDFSPLLADGVTSSCSSGRPSRWSAPQARRGTRWPCTKRPTPRQLMEPACGPALLWAAAKLEPPFQQC